MNLILKLFQIFFRTHLNVINGGVNGFDFDTKLNLLGNLTELKA